MEEKFEQSSLARVRRRFEKRFSSLPRFKEILPRQS